MVLGVKIWRDEVWDKGMLQLWGVCLLAECKVKRRWRGSINFPPYLMLMEYEMGVL